MPPPTLRPEIDELFRRHNPGKLSDVEKLILKYGESDLLTMMKTKYEGGGGASPRVEASPTPRAETLETSETPTAVSNAASEKKVSALNYFVLGMTVALGQEALKNGVLSRHKQIR